LHYALAGIHPFQDGNGRTARLVNNLHLIQHGFPPVLLRLEDRAAYIDALEKSHTAGKSGAADAAPFLVFMTTMQEQSLNRYLKVIDVINGHGQNDHANGR
jgi:Fic family protein